MKTKGIFKKITAFAASVCLLATSLPFALTGYAAGGYTTAEDLGSNELWHYNGILFGDWIAKQADVEGAIAVRKSATLATVGSFSIAANGVAKVMGDYNPKQSDYPVVLFGTDPAKGDTITKGNFGVDTSGDAVFLNSAQQYYTDNNLRSLLGLPSANSAYFVDDAEVDRFFAAAESFYKAIFSYFGNVSSVTVNSVTDKVFNQNGLLTKNSASAYEITVPGFEAYKIMMLTCTDGGVAIEDLHVTQEYEKYDLIIMNFPNALTVSYTNYSNIHLPVYPYNNYGIYQNIPLSAASNTLFPGSSDVTYQDIYNKQIDWTNRMVWLFPEATDITINGGSVVGSVIAPKASVSGKGGNINGMLIANNLEQEAGFELHAYRLNPILPKIVEEIDPPTDPAKKTDVNVAKLDVYPLGSQTGHEGLEGAELQLAYWDEAAQDWLGYYAEFENDAAKDTVVTGAGGLVELKDLTCGLKYRLQETKAPDGYLLPTGSAAYTEFELDADGKLTAGQYTITKDGQTYTLDIVGVDSDVCIFNEPATAAVQLYKYAVDADGVSNKAPLEGAGFGMRQVLFDSQGNETGDTVVAQLVSRSDGMLYVTSSDIYPVGSSLLQLEAGVYRIFEHTAPVGVEVPQEGEYYTIEVWDNRAPGAVAPDMKVRITDWNSAPVDEDSGVFSIPNMRTTAPSEIRVNFIKSNLDTSGGTPLAGAEFDLYVEVFPPTIPSPAPPVAPGSALLPQGDEADQQNNETGGPEEDETQADALPDEEDENSGVQEEGEPGAVDTADGGEQGAQPAAHEADGGSAAAGLAAGGINAPFVRNVSQADETQQADGETAQTDEETPQTGDMPQTTNDGARQAGDTPQRAPASDPPTPASWQLGVDYDYEHTDGTFWKKANGAPLVSSSASGDRGYIATLPNAALGVTEVNIGDRYMLVETKAPEGYQLAAEPWFFTINDSELTQRFWLKNDALPDDGSIHLKKVDENGDPVVGATFQLRYRAADSGTYTLIDTFTIDSDNGSYVLDNLPLGYYWLQETSAPKGYDIPEANTFFQITAGDVQGGDGSQANPYTGHNIGLSSAIEILNTNYTVRLVLAKLDRADQSVALEGVKFYAQYRANFGDAWQPYVSAASADGWYTTDASGEIDFVLREGIYRIEEIETLDGYKVTSAVYDFTVDSSSPPNAQRYLWLRVFNEKTVTGDVDVRKVDHADQTKGVGGAQFTLYTLPSESYRAILQSLQDGDITLQQAIENPLWRVYTNVPARTLVTDANGDLNITRLESGFYKLVETSAPDGYTLWGDARDIVLFEMQYLYDAVKDENYVALGEIYGSFSAQDGDALIFEDVSTGELDPGIALFYKVDKDSGAGLEGAEFRVDMLQLDGSWREIGRYESEADTGKLTITGLYPGSYRLVETRAPSGYALDPTPHYFEMVLDINADTVELDAAFSQIENTKEENAKYAQISVKKVDHNDKTTPLAGTTFDLRRYTGPDDTEKLNEMFRLEGAEALALARSLAGSWDAYPDEASNTYVTGADGTVALTDVVPGIYRIEEIKPPPGYQLWGDERDVIYVAVVDQGRLDSQLDVAILGNHMTSDGQIVFADIPVEETATPPATPTPTTPVNTAGGDGSPATGDGAAGALLLQILLGGIALVMMVFFISVKRVGRAAAQQRSYYRRRR